MNEHQKPDLIHVLLTGSSPDSAAETVHTLPQWRRTLTQLAARWTLPVDCAIHGGFCSGSIGMAFSFGYQNALRAIAPDHVDQQPASFCVTETGGNSPSAIQTTLTSHPDGHWILNGRKSFVTGAEHAHHLLVAATTGKDDLQRNRLVMVLVTAQAPGVTIEPLPPLPFAPDVSHGSATFVDVRIPASARLPGDGYTDYVKPFRTVEDIHVSAALLGYLLQTAQRYHWPDASLESLAALIALHRSLALMPPQSGTTHIVLAGARAQLEDWLKRHDECWSLVPAAIADAWHRDAVLMDVAAKARTRRTQSAWETLRGARP